MARTQNSRKATLAHLVKERPIIGEEDAGVDLEFVEKQGIPKSRFPDLYKSVQQHMAELQEQQRQVAELEATRNRQGGYFSWLFSNAKRGLTPAQYKETLDSVVNNEVATMKALNGDTRKAIRYVNDEAKHLQAYGDFTLEEFKSAKGMFLTAYNRYAGMQQAAEQLKSEAASLPSRSEDSTEKKKMLDDTLRELGKLRNKMYIYAERGSFFMDEREAVFTREQSLRDVMYELQKMGESTTMFLQSVEQTYNSVPVLQMAYRTAEALHLSFSAASDIAETSGLIATAATARTLAYATTADHTFRATQLRQSREQRDAAANPGKQDLIESFLERLSKPLAGTAAPQKHAAGYAPGTSPKAERNGYHPLEMMAE